MTYMASPARFELTAPGLGILCSILLSYGDTAAMIHGSTGIAKPAVAQRWNVIPRKCECPVVGKASRSSLSETAS
jgi:hypothetical protein